MTAEELEALAAALRSVPEVIAAFPDERERFETAQEWAELIGDVNVGLAPVRQDALRAFKIRIRGSWSDVARVLGLEYNSIKRIANAKLSRDSEAGG